MGGYRRHTYASDIAGPAWLYRLYGGTQLLYVGVSSNTRQRFARHRQRTSWWRSTDRVVLRWFPTRAAAFAAERTAIAEEQPLHNLARPNGVPA